MSEGWYQRVADIATIYDEIVSAPPDRPFVVAQLGQSLDGRIATASGDSRWINADGALDHLHRLRACVDAVVVGVGTVIADNPQLTVRRTDGNNPTRVVIDPNGRMPSDARMLNDNAAPCWLVRNARSGVAHDDGVIGIPSHQGGLPPAAIVAELFKRGCRRILIEGGAKTVSRFLDARVINQLHLLVAPMIIGSGVAGLDLKPIAQLSDALRPRTRLIPFADGDVLFVCTMAAAIKE